MSHPYQEHREHHVERNRVHRIAGHHEETRTYHHINRARGGRVHEDEAEDRAVVKGMVKPSALKHEGHKAKHRVDKPHRAKGGRVKKNKATVVNVNVAPQQPQAHPAPVPVPMPHPAMGAPPPQAAAPPMPPRPPMAGPPGGPPGMPPMMGPRASGGRVGYKTGGPVEPHLKQGVGMGPTGKGVAGGKATKLGKNAIYAPAKGDMGPTSLTGMGGAVARMEMSHRAAKQYRKAPPGVHTP